MTHRPHPSEQSPPAGVSAPRGEDVLLECVPNLSEGRDPDLIGELCAAVEGPGVRLAHQTSDVDHHRTVLTILGSPPGLLDAIDRLLQRSMELLDLRGHEGVHPRLGILDVVPFVPLAGSTMRHARETALAAGRRLAKRVPVYLYERVATSPQRVDLAAHRRGGLDGLRRRLADASWTPDCGPETIDPRFGVVMVGAREPLIAFNVDLDSPTPEIARRIAARIRQRAPGGLPGVKALGMALRSRGCSQVSMNVVSPELSTLYAIVERVRLEAQREGARVLRSELIGLLPESAAFAALGEALQLPIVRDDLLDEQVRRFRAGND